MYYAFAFVLFCVVCSVLAFKRHPIYGLYFYLATTFVYPQGRWWGYLFNDLRWALLSALIWALAIAFHQGKLRAKPLWLANTPAIVMVLYSLWLWIQSPWALDLPTHLSGSFQFAKYILAFWMAYRVIDSKEHLRDFLLFHMLGCALLGIFAQFIGRQGDRLDGVGGPGIDDANTLGMYLVTGAIVGAGLVLTQTGWRRYLSLASLVFIVNGFVLANSRGAFLGLVAGGLVLMLCKAHAHRKSFWAFAVAGLLGLAVLIDQAFIDRMFTIQDATSQEEEADMSARSRLAVAQAQLQMFLDHPQGVGHRGTASLSTQYLDPKWLTKEAGGDDSTAARSSHNTFLTALVEQGIPGALLFIVASLWTLAFMLRLRRMRSLPEHNPELVTLAAAMCGALAVVFTAGNTTDYLLAELQFWLFAGLVSVPWLSQLSTAPVARPSDGIKR